MILLPQRILCWKRAFQKFPRPALMCATKIVLSSNVRGCPRGKSVRPGTRGYPDVRTCPGVQPRASRFLAIVFSKFFDHGFCGVFQTGVAREKNKNSLTRTARTRRAPSRPRCLTGNEPCDCGHVGFRGFGPKWVYPL